MRVLLVGSAYLAGASLGVNQAITSEDLCARLDGEESVILLPGFDQNATCQAAARIREGIEALSLSQRRQPDAVIDSFGIAQWDGNAELGALIREADVALYRAKHAGRNRVLAGGSACPLS